LIIMQEFSEYFQRQDDAPDAEFYRQPRLVAHIDDAAIAALGTFLNTVIPKDAVVLDLMSAYLTHLLPNTWARCRRVAGLGMNREEMDANTQLTDFVVHDLNQNPALPFQNAAFDAAICTVSVQYLLRPNEVFTEVGRILKPGAPFIVSFSNRCFPTKATRLWLATDDAQHQALVQLYFERAGVWENVQIQTLSLHPGRTDPLFVVWARRSCFS
jgi:SAM-dependent methyltransferase